MKKKFMAGVLLLSTTMIANGVLSVHEASAKENVTNGQVTFEGGAIDIDPDEPNPDDPNNPTHLLPQELNFGETIINFEQDANLKATKDGKQESEATTGKLRINDKSGTGNGWVVKVNQTQFKQGDNELTGAELSITTGEATNTGGTIPTGGKLNQKATLTPGEEMEVFKANKGEGSGVSELPLNQFDLNIPAAANKTVGQYVTTITWTVSETA